MLVSVRLLLYQNALYRFYLFSRPFVFIWKIYHILQNFTDFPCELLKKKNIRYNKREKKNLAGQEDLSDLIF